jgi:hypothetical protein
LINFHSINDHLWNKNKEELTMKCYKLLRVSNHM